MSLEDEHFIKEAKYIIQKFWRQARVNENLGLSWELMKFEIRKLAICTGETKAKLKQNSETEIITKMITLSKQTDPSSNNITELLTNTVRRYV